MLVPLLAASAAVSIYGSISEAKARKKQAQAEAVAARARASEFKRRADENIKVAERQGQRAILEGSFKVPVGAAGYIKENIEASYDTNFDTLEKNLQTARINADYDYQLILSGAEAKDAEAADAYSGLGLKIASTILGGGKDYMVARNTYNPTPKIPNSQ